MSVLNVKKLFAVSHQDTDQEFVQIQIMFRVLTCFSLECRFLSLTLSYWEKDYITYGKRDKFCIILEFTKELEFLTLKFVS